MKHNLGKIFCHCLILLSLGGLLDAADFTYSIHTSKKTVHLHEPLQLTVNLKQTNPDVVLLFHFKINKSPNYEVKPLQSKYADTLHHIDQHRVYTIYPLKTGDINISFSLVKRLTTDDKVRYFASGDRDDFKKLETIDSVIHIPPVHIHVKDLPKGTQLVGDFNLSYHANTHHTTSFSPINMDITLQGRGYPPELKQLIPKDKRYTLFSEKPTIKTSRNKKNTHTIAHYLFALSAKTSFSLAPISIKAFNPYTQTPYTLTLPEQNFTIDAVKASALLDPSDTPVPLKVDWSWIQSIFSYVLVFLSGYLTAIAIMWANKKKQHTQHPLEKKILREKIQACETDKALLRVLMSQEGKTFTSCIEKLEDSIYKDSQTPLKILKKEALENIV